MCCAGELQGAALTRLTLQTLGSFDFGSTRLLEFVRDHVTPYLDDGDVCVRKAAAAAAAAVLHRTASAPPGSRAAAHPQVLCLCLVQVHGPRNPKNPWQGYIPRQNSSDVAPNQEHFFLGRAPLRTCRCFPWPVSSGAFPQRLKN